MTIEPFITSDQALVSDFWKAIWKELHWDGTIEGSDDIPNFLHFPQGFMIVIKDGEKMIGCAGVKPLTSTTGIIKRFYLDPSLRGTGIASTLLDKVIEESKIKQFKKLVLDVYYTNLRAIRFYEKHGFTRYLQNSVPEWEETLYPEEYFYYKLTL